MNKKLRNKVLNIIKPTEKEAKARNDIVNNFISKLEKCSEGIDVKFFIGGSFGKNTYLKTSSDVDIFARFSLNYNDEELSDMLIKILEKTKIKFKKQKGSRDYYSCIIEKIKFEIVPNRRINDVSEMLNSTDVSPLHVEFLKSKCSENKNLCDEIRLAKQFFKAKELYGAESYINGISGHVIDILISFYGSLGKLLENVKEWGEETYIDINSFYSSIEEAKEKLDDDKLSKLIVVDPILKSRNAARALSDENYSKLIILAQNFTDFREEDFEVKKFNLMKTIKLSKKFGKVNGMNTLFYIFDFSVGDNSEDIIGSKLLKLFKRLERKFNENDFKVFLSKFYISMKDGQCLFVYFIENSTVPRLKKIVGPYVYMKSAVSAFTNSHEIYFVEEDRLYSYEQREVYSLDKIAKLDLNVASELVGKDISFVKKLRILRK